MEIKKILITGCSGFIGRNVAALALKEGYEVVGLDIKPCTVEGVKFINADITDRAKMMKAVSGVDAVIHLAAVTANTEFEKDMLRCYDVNVNGFMNVIDAAVKNKCGRFVYASSAAIYIDSFSEESVIDIKKQKNSYAKTKLIDEMIARSYQDIYNISAVGLRFFNVYGNGENEKGNYASIVIRFKEMKKAGSPLLVYGDGKQARDMINVSDAAKIALVLMQRGTHDVYNVGTGESVPYNDIADALDRKNKKFVKNPLSSYQLLTKADTTRLRSVIGDYKFIKVKDWIKE